mmetsp:Transcript_1126/g.3243  ORF Transcript_1126/g.3243 Transcript_1126/m.3243 type:complete len:351 (+) Transcript_1126:124-1176(+)
MRNEGLALLLCALPARGAEFYYLLHIPKTAGQSLYRDLPATINCTHVLPRFGYARDTRRHLASRGRKHSKANVRFAPDTYAGEMAGLLESEGYDRDGCNLYHAEGLWDIADDLRTFNNAPARVVTVLREPTTHVVSLYEHNRNSGFDTRRMTFTQKKQPTLEQWLRIALARNTTQLGTQHNPLNMQTARLSARRGTIPRTSLGLYPRKGELYRDELRADLETALRRIESDAWFVGVTEYYREGLCLLREQALGRLPPECRCDDTAAKPRRRRRRLSVPLTETHNRHHARYDDRPFTGAELKLIGAATRLDRLVYGAALARFTRQLLDAERRHNARILCRDGTSTLQLSRA